MVNMEIVLSEATKNNRVCPQPKQWHKIYRLFEGISKKRNLSEPSLPLILAAWWDTPSIMKMIRFREHIKWANDNGCIQQVYDLLTSFSEDEWYHVGE